MENIVKVVLLGTPPALGNPAVIMKTISIIICGKSLPSIDLGEVLEVQQMINVIGKSYKERGLFTRSLIFVETAKTKYGSRDFKHGGRHRQRVVSLQLSTPIK